MKQASPTRLHCEVARGIGRCKELEVASQLNALKTARRIVAWPRIADRIAESEAAWHRIADRIADIGQPIEELIG